MIRPQVAPGRVNRDQLAALLKLQLAQAFRPGIAAMTGARQNPLRQIVLSMAFMGLVFSANVRVHATSPLFIRALFGTAAGMTLLSLIPDQSDVRTRRADIFACRPVSGATWLTCQLITLSITGALISVAFGTIPVIAAWRWLGIPAHRAVIDVALLVVQGAALGVAWLRLLAFLARFTAVDSIRRVALKALSVFALLLSGSSMAGASAGIRIAPDGTAAHVIDAIPLTWLGALAEPGEGRLLVLQGAGVALGAIGIGAMLLGDLEKRQQRIAASINRSVAKASRPARSLQVAALALFRPMLPRRGAALAELLLTLDSREDLARSRRFTFALLATGMFVALVTGILPAEAALRPIAFVATISVVEGVNVALHSAVPAASVVVATSPLSGRDLASGMLATVMVRLALMPGLFLVTGSIVALPPGLWIPGLVATAGSLRLAAAALFAWRAQRPLSTGEPAFAPMASVGVGLLLTIALSIVLAIVRFIAEGSLAGFAIAVGIGLAIAASSFVIERIAGARIAAAR